MRNLHGEAIAKPLLMIGMGMFVTVFGMVGQHLTQTYMLQQNADAAIILATQTYAQEAAVLISNRSVFSDKGITPALMLDARPSAGNLDLKTVSKSEGQRQSLEKTLNDYPKAQRTNAHIKAVQTFIFNTDRAKYTASAEVGEIGYKKSTNSEEYNEIAGLRFEGAPTKSTPLSSAPVDCRWLLPGEPGCCPGSGDPQGGVVCVVCKAKMSGPAFMGGNLGYKREQFTVSSKAFVSKDASGLRTVLVGKGDDSVCPFTPPAPVLCNPDTNPDCPTECVPEAAYCYPRCNSAIGEVCINCQCVTDKPKCACPATPDPVCPGGRLEAVEFSFRCSDVVFKPDNYCECPKLAKEQCSGKQVQMNLPYQYNCDTATALAPSDPYTRLKPVVQKCTGSPTCPECPAGTTPSAEKQSTLINGCQLWCPQCTKPTQLGAITPKGCMASPSRLNFMTEFAQSKYNTYSEEANVSRMNTLLDAVEMNRATDVQVCSVIDQSIAAVQAGGVPIIGSYLNTLGYVLDPTDNTVLGYVGGKDLVDFYNGFLNNQYNQQDSASNASRMKTLFAAQKNGEISEAKLLDVLKQSKASVEAGGLPIIGTTLRSIGYVLDPVTGRVMGSSLGNSVYSEFMMTYMTGAYNSLSKEANLSRTRAIFDGLQSGKITQSEFINAISQSMTAVQNKQVPVFGTFLSNKGYIINSDGTVAGYPGK